MEKNKIKNKKSTKFIIPILSVFSVFAWEHVAIINNIKYRPTAIINMITSVLEKLWMYSGIIYAYVGTYYEYLHLEKIYDTIESFYLSFKNFVFSIKYFNIGFDSVAALYQHPNIINLCSGIVVCVILLVTYYFLSPRFERWLLGKPRYKLEELRKKIPTCS